jgi:beta-N-acetylhexosaminidase
MNSQEIKKILGQTFIIGFQDKIPSNEVKNFITNNNIGGVILFDRNIESPSQLADLTNELQGLVQKSSLSDQLFVSIDMEGGRVARLKTPFTQGPPMSVLGEIGSASLAFKFAECMGKELLAVGINVDYSPCVDVLTNPNNKVIGDRSFGSDPELVSKMSSAVVRGFVKAGIIPCVKHFPGHGDTIADSHEELPVVNYDLDRLEAVEFIPFKKAFRARADLVMTAHIKMEKLDPEWPATLSQKIIQKILRQKLGYRNAIITDDMEMKAVFANYTVEQAAVQAVKAGCTILLYCHTLEVQERALEALTKAVVDKEISETIIRNNCDMVLRIKKESLKPYAPVNLSEIANSIGHPDHLKLSKLIARKEIPADLTT